jgi:hypothetical protein
LKFAKPPLSHLFNLLQGSTDYSQKVNVGGSFICPVRQSEQTVHCLVDVRELLVFKTKRAQVRTDGSEVFLNNALDGLPDGRRVDVHGLQRRNPGVDSPEFF